MLSAPVREAVRTTTKTKSAVRAALTARLSAPDSCSQTVATSAQSSRLLRWLGWRMLPTARPSM